MENKQHTVWEMLTDEELKEDIIYHTYMGDNVGDSVYAEIHRKQAVDAWAELNRRRREADDSPPTSSTD